MALLRRYCPKNGGFASLFNNVLRCLEKYDFGKNNLPLKKVAVKSPTSLLSKRAACTACRVKSQALFNLITFSDSGKRFSTSKVMRRLSNQELKKRMDDLTDRFAEARELLGDARESLGSTYFSEDMTEAQEAVVTTLDLYRSLLTELEEDQRDDIIRTIGLRMEELKAQEAAIKDLLE